MKKNIHSYFTWCLILIGILHTYTCGAQNHKKDGDAAWEIGKYKTAVNNYGKVINLKTDKKLLAKRGLGFFKINNLDKAISHFTLAKKLGNDDPELFLLMAQAKHHLDHYEEAAFFYKSYIKEVGEKTDKAKLALKEMKNCSYAAFHAGDKASGFVQKFDKKVNTYHDEIFPMQSPRFGNIYYFTSNRNLKDMEVYSYEMDATGGWKKNDAFGIGINSSEDEYVMDISPDGLSMLFVKAKENNNTNKIYVSTFDSEEKQHIIALPDYLIDGAMDLQMVDYNTIAFASQDLGGEGGYDIFTIDYKNGIWSDPKNAGPVINTTYDERSPYYASTSEQIYFSSNKPYCYGGYDIYYYNTLSVNPEPINLGLPINSSGNDLQFRLNEDGQMAVISSDRKTGAGAYDIYMAYLSTPRPMPARDMRQLSYVKDYLDYINPTTEVAEVESPTSHLDRLKQRLDIKQDTIETKDPNASTVVNKDENIKEKPKSIVEEEVADITKLNKDIANAIIKEDTSIDQSVGQEEPSGKAKKMPRNNATKTKTKKKKKTNNKGNDEPIIIQPNLPGKTTKINQPKKESKKSEIVATNEKEEVLDALAKYIGTEKDEIGKDNGEKSEIEKKKNEIAVVEPKLNPSPTPKKAKPKAKQKPSTPNLNSKNNLSTDSKKDNQAVSNIPQPASDESPLANIKKESKAQTTLPKLKSISGEDIDYAMLYQDRHDLNNNINKPKLKALSALLKKNKKYKIHIIAHTDHLEPGLPEFMQYNTLKRANYVGRYLMENSINKDRISIESVSANYPIVKPEVAGQVNVDYLAYNKRIDFEIRDNKNQLIAKHNIDTKAIPDYAQDRKYELYRQIRDELYYSIEIGRSDHIFKNAVLRLYSDIYIRKNNPISENKYYIGMLTRIEDVIELQKELEASSSPYAKIRAFYNGQPVQKSQIENLSKEYPELRKLLVQDP